jgi:hypothetical protein
MTTWINKEKFKDENFSVKEGFAGLSKSSNPLEQFLKANPLKSVFEIEPVNSRVEDPILESFDPNDNLTNVFDPNDDPKKTFNPIDDQDSVDNINPIGTPGDKIFEGKYSTKIDNKSEKKLTREDIVRDDKLIDSILVSLFSLFITLYVSYNWYFNFTEGFSKRIPFYEKFDVVNYMYFFSEYFYKIVRFFDETATIRMPKFVKIVKESFCKERSIFVVIFFISHYAVKYFISFLRNMYNYVKTFVQTGKIDIIKLFYDPKKKNIYITLMFAFFVLEGIISSFKGGFIDKMDPTKALDPTKGLEEALDPSASFKQSLTAFKVANPLLYLIVILIRVAIIYGPTISSVTGLIFIYFGFYSMFGVLYYHKLNSDPIDEANLYNGVRDESFLDMFRRIHAVMNLNGVVFEYTEESGFIHRIKRFFEWILRNVFNNLPFLIMIFGLIRAIPSVLKIYSPILKWTGITLISGFGLAIIKFMLAENPKMYILQEKILNFINGSVQTITQVLEKEPITISE